MVSIAIGETFTVTMFTRTTRSHLLFLFWNVSTGAEVKCIVALPGVDPIIAPIEDTSPDAPDPLAGEIALSPRGEWGMNVYAQNSSTDLDYTSGTARELIHTEQAWVETDCCEVASAYTGSCPPVPVIPQTPLSVRVEILEEQMNGYYLGDPDVDGQIPITRDPDVDLVLQTQEP